MVGTKSSFQNGDFVRVEFEGKSFEGTVIPSANSKTLQLKLKSGYNAGFSLSQIKVSKIGESKKAQKPAAKTIPFNSALPSILILHTGGTIASRVDYTTGGVTAGFEAQDLLTMFPELEKKANFETRKMESMESENMRFFQYCAIAKEIEKADAKKFSGIIIAHGTDTLAYTSAALAFMVQNPAIPVLLVGAQRSSDRGSSDAAQNLSCAVDFITKTDFCGIGICMHENENDSTCVVLPATKSRKLHTSRRDAFCSVNAKPIGRIDYASGKTEFLDKNYPRKESQKQASFKIKLEEKVGLLKSHPSLVPEQIKVFEKLKFKGLIVEGTGLGHLPVISRDPKDKTNDRNFKALESLIKKGCVVGMVSQCIFGSTQMHVYGAGPKLKSIGVLEGKDMLAETALIKLAWLLGNYSKKEAEKLFGENMVGEINERQPLNSQNPSLQFKE
ncbi:MAG: Glu-tRNA(Gln) amidotransferase subunit GatD [Candidatus Micrarchaeota archaeon]